MNEKLHSLPSHSKTTTKAMPFHMIKFFFLLEVLLVLHVNISGVISARGGFRGSLRRIDTQDNNLTKLQLHQRAVHQSRQRMAALMANESSSSELANSEVQAPIHYGDMAYEMELIMGTPPVRVTGVIDTWEELIWTQCQPCTQCPHLQAPTYDPLKSSTFSKVPCNSTLCQALRDHDCSPDCTYHGNYYDTYYTRGVLATETLWFETAGMQQVSIPNIGFGCSELNQSLNLTGAVGLNRGPLSLISQLGTGRFSYCLTPFGDSNASPLLFGSLAALNESSAIPLVHDVLPRYFLPLKGISLGISRLPIPEEAFKFHQNGLGGLTMDTTSPYSFLVKDAYEMLIQELTASLKLRVVNPLSTDDGVCYLMPSNSSVEVPKLTFHFEGADLEFSADNYMIRDPSTDLLCLAILKAGPFSSLGTFQQQNMHVVYDLIGQKISISPAQCDRL